MLKFNPHSRISAKEALAHPYFSDLDLVSIRGYKKYETATLPTEDRENNPTAPNRASKQARTCGITGSPSHNSKLIAADCRLHPAPFDVDKQARMEGRDMVWYNVSS
jgi:serine/threonine protein kinase